MGLGAGVTDAHSTGGAGEATVGDKRDLLAVTLTVNEGGDAEHFAHARAAAGALVADEDGVSQRVETVGDGVLGCLLAFEDACGAPMTQRFEASRLQNGAVRAEVAFENNQAAAG